MVVRKKKLSERTVFDGLHPAERLSWEVVFLWERTLSEIDAEIAKLTASRGAYVKLISEAARTLREAEENSK